MDPSIRIDRSPPIPGPYSGSPQGSPSGGNPYGGGGGGMRGRGMGMSRLAAMSPDAGPQYPQGQLTFNTGPTVQRAPGMSGMLATRGTRRMQGYTMPPKPTDMHGVTPGRAQELPGPDYMQAQRQRLAAALGPQNSALAGYMGG